MQPCHVLVQRKAGLYRVPLLLQETMTMEIRMQYHRFQLIYNHQQGQGQGTMTAEEQSCYGLIRYNSG